MQKAVVPSEVIGRWIDVTELEREAQDTSPESHTFRRDTDEGPVPLASTHGPRMQLRYRPFEALANRLSREALRGAT